MERNQKTASINQTVWEVELDTLGSCADITEYVRMLQKAPPASRSLQTLTDFVQAKLS